MSKDFLSQKADLYRNFVKRIINECRFIGCFHEDQSCGDKIIKAHSIQHNRILKRIADSGNLLNFDFELNKPIEELKDAQSSISFGMSRIGKLKASTFRGFCNCHDQRIFKPIEESDYNVGDVEQEFLFSYRALAKAYSDSITIFKYLRKLIEMTNNGTYSDILKIVYDKEIPKELYVYIESELHEDANTELLIIDLLEKMRLKFNNYLDERLFDEISTNVLVFNEEYLLAVSSMIYLHKDLEGEIINDFDSPNYNPRPLFISVFPQQSNTFVILSYLRKDRKYFEFIKKELMRYSLNTKRRVISNIICNKIDNFYYSPILWDKLSERTKSAFLNKFILSASPVKQELDYFADINILI